MAEAYKPAAGRFVSRTRLQGGGIRLEPVVPTVCSWPREEGIESIILETTMRI